jgi:hypothetical protein
LETRGEMGRLGSGLGDAGLDGEAGDRDVVTRGAMGRVGIGTW